MTRERAAFGALALLAVALWALAPTYPGIDSYYHLVWGRELAHGHTPTFDSYRAPTHHPLWVLAGALLSLSGEHGDRLLVLGTLLCFVVFVWGLWRLGAEVFGEWPGVAGAVFAGTSFAFLLYAVRGFLDVPFLALVAWAGALEAGAPAGEAGKTGGRGAPHGVPVMALLAVAGLLRPEAWLLSGAYWLWCRPGADHRARALLAAIGLAAPVLWLAVDAAATGDALFSFHSTGKLAEELAHTGGPGAVAANLLKFLAFSIRPPVLVLGLVGLALALRRGGWRPVVVPLALLGGGTLAFVATGLAGLSILPRYLVVPAAALCLFAGYALLGFTAMDPAATGTATLRRRWARAAGAVGLLGVFAAGALLVTSGGRVTSELRFVRTSHDQLARLLRSPAMARARRCGPITMPADRLVPDVRWILDAPVGAVLARTAPGRRPYGVRIYVLGSGRAVDRFGHAAGIPESNDIPPAGQVPFGRSGPFAAYVTCPVTPLAPGA